MTKYHVLLSGLVMLSIPIDPLSGVNNIIKSGNNSSEPIYHLAFANFGPLNDDIFIADADGHHARPLLPNPANDYNASFSPDGQWIGFFADGKLKKSRMAGGSPIVLCDAPSVR